MEIGMIIYFKIMTVITVIISIVVILLAAWTIDSVNRRKKGKPDRKFSIYNKDYKEDKNRMIDNNKEYILCSAIKRKTPNISKPYHKNDICDIEIGYRHHDIFQRFNQNGEIIISRNPDDQGFYTSLGRFVNREQAMTIAKECGQVNKENKNKELYSEDLY